MALDLTPQLTDDPWESIVAKYGQHTALAPDVPGQHSAMMSAVPTAPLWSPQNPLFWVGAVMLATAFGAFAASGSVRVAKTKVSAGVGEA
jgi:hypothetical protein